MNMTTVPSNQLKAMQQQLADKDAEIERLKQSREHFATHADHSLQQLAASELVIQQMQEHIQTVCTKVMEAHAGPTRLADFKHVFNLKPSTEHLEAWYREMVGEPVAWGNFKDNGEACLLSISQHPEDRANWMNPKQLHAIKPFPFKGE